MAEPMVRVMQLVGALLAYGTVATALVWYLVLWPFDRAAR